MQSMKFVEAHHGNKKQVSIYGQEYTNTTYKLCKMNLAIRGISANLGETAANTFTNDQHKDLKADYIMANPPFNQKAWRAENELIDDPRWDGYEVPPTSNANCGWILNIVSKLSQNGVAGFLLANGALSDDGTELKIRKQLIENNLVEAIIILPRNLFYTTDISVTLWILNKNKKARVVEQNGQLIDNSILNEDYLMMWFRRPEFDRLCWLRTDGSVRGGITWDDICRMKVPVPPLNEQIEIVQSYQAITDRIALKKQINDNLEATAQAVFQEQFVSFYGVDELPDGYSIVNLDSLCTVKGGKRLPADCELLDTPTKHPYIRVRDVGSSRYVCLTNQFQYIDEETHSAISRYIVNTGDIVISIVGTIGLLGKIHFSLDKANLTENCVKLANIHTVTSDYLYYTLCYKKQIKEIELLTVGAVQAKLPMYNIQSMKILVPPTKVMEEFQNKMNVFNEQIEANRQF